MRISAAVALLFLVSLPRILAEEADASRLVRLLSSDDCAERDAAQQKLINLGDVAVPALQGTLKDADPDVRERASAAIEQIAERKERRAIGVRLRAFARDYPLLRFEFQKLGCTITLRTTVGQRGAFSVLVCDDEEVFGQDDDHVTCRDVLDLESLSSLETSSDLKYGGNLSYKNEHFEARRCDGTLQMETWRGIQGAVHEHYEVRLNLSDPPVLSAFAPLRLAACVEPSAGREWPFLWVCSASGEARDEWHWRMRCAARDPARASGGADEQGWKYEFLGPVDQGHMSLRILVLPGHGISKATLNNDTAAPTTK